MTNTEQRHEKDELAHLQNQISRCRLCWDSFGFEPRPVVMGNRNAKIMQISQAPSKRVHETGLPFNDSSGKRLRKEWYGIPDQDFYNPDHFYIASMAHCYPGKSPGKGDRHPPKICSQQWLLKEMALVDNEIYIIIGRIAADLFFPGEKMSSMVFEDKQINGKPAYVLPHPSPLNIKWFRDYPEFMNDRIFKIRKEVQRIYN
ncbi:MAG: uracil-DNA glycosylase family protein [Oscillospiraceae bacterium]|jgi:uracil-DNA glycosylase family 4